MNKTLLALAACLFSLSASAGSPPPPFHVDLGEYLQSGNRAGSDKYWAFVSQVRKDFDNICGDTFCEGDIHNWQVLSTDCSIQVGTERVRECHIVMAGSEQELNPTTGSYRLTRKELLDCKMEMNMSLKDFLKIEGLETEYKNGKGETTTLYNGLVDCIP